MRQFHIQVRPSPETNDFEVCLLADDANLIHEFDTSLMGMDPNDLLAEPSPLHARSNPHPVTIGRCTCGVVGCGNTEVEIKREGDLVTWSGVYVLKQVDFLASQYENEVERALSDFSWETPDRTAARFIANRVDQSALERNGFVFSWASAQCQDGMMTVSLDLRSGPHQVLVHLPWDGKSTDGIADEFVQLLRQPPESWPQNGTRNHKA